MRGIIIIYLCALHQPADIYIYIYSSYMLLHLQYVFVVLGCVSLVENQIIRSKTHRFDIVRC